MSNPPQEDEALEQRIETVLLDLISEISSIRAGKTFTPTDYSKPAKASLLTIMREASIEELQKVYEFPKGRFKTDIYNMMEFAHNRIEQLKKGKHE